jgi:5'-3' exonuclease
LRVHLIDGTYELFRFFYGVPSRRTADGIEVGATRGVVGSLLSLLESGATHIAVATDHVIESFRNALWPGYKDGSGIDPDLFSQFSLLEGALAAAGFTVWPMVEHEADDGLGAGAAMAAADPRVEQVLICTPDKDLAQCVVGRRIVQFDRRARRLIDEEGVREKFGVSPESIPDYLALVGDSADGYPGLPGWGAKSTSTVLARYPHLEQIPARVEDWDVRVRGAARLSDVLENNRELAALFRRIATIDRRAPVSPHVDEMEWRGPGPDFESVCRQMEAADLPSRADRILARRR